jgi:hypothetical protein
MKKSNKKSLEKRGIVIAGRAQCAPRAQLHDDKRREIRGNAKQKLKLDLQYETARLLNSSFLYFIPSNHLFDSICFSEFRVFQDAPRKKSFYFRFGVR